MDKASDFGSEDWGFESLRGQIFLKKHRFILDCQELSKMEWCTLVARDTVKSLLLQTLYKLSLYFDDFFWNVQLLAKVLPNFRCEKRTVRYGLMEYHSKWPLSVGVTWTMTVYHVGWKWYFKWHFKTNINMRQITPGAVTEQNPRDEASGSVLLSKWLVFEW